MKNKCILRREWFGGLLVSLPGGSQTFLGPKDYELKKVEMLSNHNPGFEAKVIDVTQMGYPLLGDALSSPAGVYFELTRRCDGTCAHCLADAGAGFFTGELNLNELKILMDQLAAFGVYFVRLTGGEPTLREDFFDILDLIADIGLRPSLNTHGRYGQETLDRILEKGIKDLYLSLDGTEQINDAIRGKGSYHAVLATLRYLAEYNQTACQRVEPRINVTLMKSNRHCVRSLTELAVRTNCKISFGLLRPVGRANWAEVLNPEQMMEAASEVHHLRESLGLAKSQVIINYDVCGEREAPTQRKPFPFNNSKCPIGAITLGISSQGRIVPCNYFAHMEDGAWIGEDVRCRNLLDLWHHSVVVKEARKVRRGCCHGCAHYVTQCNGGCPAAAYLSQNRMDGRDPCCVRDIPMPEAITSSNKERM